MFFIASASVFHNHMFTSCDGVEANGVTFLRLGRVQWLCRNRIKMILADLVFGLMMS